MVGRIDKNFARQIERGRETVGEEEPKRAHDATPHPAIVNESTMSRIMHNELFRVDVLMPRTMMRARAPEHPAKGGWRPRESSLFPLSSNLLSFSSYYN